MELDGELKNCSLTLKLGLWLSIRLFKYRCTLMSSVVFPYSLCMYCGVVVEVPTRVCCGGVSSALKLDISMSSCSLRLRMDSRLYMGLCINMGAL